MSTELTINQQQRSVNFFDPAQMESIQRAAKMFANSDLVPEMYQIGAKNNTESKAIANCVIAMNMATRMNADVLMIMQNLVIIYGRPSWSSTFLISSVNSCGRFEPLKYKFTNKGKLGKVDYTDYEWNGQRKVAVTKTFDGSKIDNIECVAYTKAKGSDEILESSPIDLEMAIKEGWYTKSGSKWTTMERQMLMYRSASFWVRAYAPEISMGMYTVEEVQDMGGKTIDVEAEIVDTKVEREIQENANKETFSMKVEEPVETVNETATKVAEQPKETPAEELFQNSENKVKREF